MRASRISAVFILLLCAFSWLQMRWDLLNAATDPSGTYGKIYVTPRPDDPAGMIFRRKAPVIADKDEHAGTINAGIISVIPQYVRKLEKFSCRVVMDGDSVDLKVYFAKGYAGDFKHKESGLVVHDASIEADGIKTDMDPSGGLKILSVGEVRLNSLTVKQRELEDFLKIYAGKFRITSVKLEKGIIDISGVYLKTPVEAAVFLYNPNPGKTGSDIFFRVVKLKAAGISIPAGLVNFALKGYNPLLNKSNSPIKISFGRIYAENGELNIK